ncbi:MAG: hypothetical protein IKS39_00615 [Clostridia bacterium]|nr:hypothetical protein [Clostridia bacterium]
MNKTAISIIVLLLVANMVTAYISYNIGKNSQIPSSAITSTTSISVESTYVTEMTQPTTQFDLSSYMDSCSEVTYETLMRNPEAYLNEPICIKGEAHKVSENKQTNGDIDVWFLLWMYEKALYEISVYYTLPANSPHIIDGDHVTIYGEYTGQQTYKNGLGNDEVLPVIQAKNIVVDY